MALLDFAAHGGTEEGGEVGMTIEEWAKDFKAFVNELQMPRDDYKGIIAYIDDGVKLLKTQEPRAMTKEEIIGWDGYIWFEFNGMKAMKTVLIDHGMVREPFRGDYPTKELSWGTCQETWRAWTAMPTAEQRKATPWEPPKGG